MTNLEKSIRKNLHYYLEPVRSGHWQAMGSTGLMPEGVEFVSSAYADVVDGLCTDIMIYSPTGGKERRHAEMFPGVVDITDIITGWVSGRDESDNETSYDSTVQDIMAQILSRQ